MAKANPVLIKALKKTVLKLKNGASYQWGHMGACNCGNLAQEISQLSKGDIHRYAMQGHGDWSEQLRDYCPTSGYPMDLLISKLLETGLDIDDLKHLERLSDPCVLALLPLGKRGNVKYNDRSDVIAYLECWIDLLEEDWSKNAFTGQPVASEKINAPCILS
ncbi:hypothetical protein [Negadavirga shengliensis]|uniref:Uncharacterized protein n=1 Tax=Negadavirga shengliensis TaxID=1389218 RepID=A0ABV9T2Q2_9BACT